MAEGWSGKPGRQQTFPRPTGNMSPPIIPTSSGGQKFFQIHARSDGEEIMDFNKQDTAVVITGPQNDFLSRDGVTWGLVVGSVEENGTIQHIDDLFSAAKQKGYDVFISPHYYFPTDKGWKFGGTVEKMTHDIGMFDRKGALSTRFSPVPAPIGWNNTSLTSREGRPSWPAPTKCTGPSPTT
jgi:hypothetical protein